MIPQNELAKEVILQMVGSSKFGRYPKISIEETWNMLVSDEWMVDYAGYKSVTTQTSSDGAINPNGVGRGNFRSTILNKLVVAVFNGVYLIDSSINITPIGTLNTYNGDVFIAEDIQGHIAICDKSQIWIYTEATGAFVLATQDGSTPLDFVPGYVAYHNGRFVSVDLESSTWRLSNPAAPSLNHYFPFAAQYVGGFQTKPDIPVAAIAFPGKSNLLLVMGKNLTEFWTDADLALFPYQKSTGINVDYGCLNSDTIAVSNDSVCWLAGNEKSGPFIAVTNSGVPTKISTDGIDFKLNTLTTPTDSHGFFFRQDGHLLYQLTFPTDNFSLVYDFNTNMFFTLCDEKMNYHIAKRAVYFNETYYFVSLNDGNLYEFNTQNTNYNYGFNSQSEYVVQEIPRIRIPPTYREKDGSWFIVNALAIPFEMGTQPDPGMYVESITVTNGGSGYSDTTVRIFGGGGQGAEAICNIGGFDLLDHSDFLLLDTTQFLLLDSDGNISAIFVSNPGENYSYPPTVEIDGDGTGALALAILSQNTLPRADLSISINGGYSFGNYVGINFNTLGNYRNRFTYFGMGMANEFTPQIRLWSKGRFVMGNGILSIYQ